MSSAGRTPTAVPSMVCTYKEAMQITGLRKSKLYTLFHKGVLRGYRDGVMIRFYRDSLIDYMQQRENHPAIPPSSNPTPTRKRKTPEGVRFKFL
jgi:excisionase family DNA binding protein